MLSESGRHQASDVQVSDRKRPRGVFHKETAGCAGVPASPYQHYRGNVFLKTLLEYIAEMSLSHIGSIWIQHRRLLIFNFSIFTL